MLDSNSSDSPSSDVGPSPFVRAYARFVDRHARLIVGVALVLSLVAGKVASTLPVHADFSYLLPPNSESVQHLRRLEKRAHVMGTLMLAVKSEDPAARLKAARAVHERLLPLVPKEIYRITYDASVGRTWAWDNRYLFAPLADLTEARDVLRAEIEKAKKHANPLLLDFEEDPSDAADDLPIDKQLGPLLEKLAELEKARHAPSELVTGDGHLQMMILQMPFSASDVSQGTEILARVQSVVDEVQKEHPATNIGLAGDVLSAQAEHRSILSGMLTATAITVALVAGVLLLYYRSGVAVLSLLLSLLCGTLITFWATRLTVGHLNIATAFLASIVLGNGINFGIMLLARHLEEIGHGTKGVEALTASIGGTFRGTLAAALTATGAYLSLVLTAFRGFRDFGYIASAGMFFCWLAAYTVLPALLAIAMQKNWLVSRGEPPVGRWLAALLPKKAWPVVTVSLLLSVLSAGVTWHFVANDPYEQNLKNLRSDTAELQEERRWMHEIDSGFGQGISGGFVIGTIRRNETQALLKKLRAVDDGLAPDDKNRLFSRLNALDDLLPQDQPEKLVVLAEIRKLLTEEVIGALPADMRDQVRALRPPADLRAKRDEDVPEALAWPFIEADGSRGKFILAMGGWGYELWDAHDIVRFAAKVRGLELGEDTLLGGSAFVFSDMIGLIERDGPRATLAATVAAVLVILLCVGVTRYAVVTLVASALGTLLMIAVIALVGLRINFLDFVALPITIGIGIDYAVNICARARIEGPGRARQALWHAGGAVCLASYTTVVGYGSLLLSGNKGIRSFGAAAILGELTCLLAAFWLAPTLLDLGQGHRTSRDIAAGTRE